MLLKPTAAERAITDPLLARFDEKRVKLSSFHAAIQEAITSSEELRPLIHSMRARIKHRDHLQDKLIRKLRECDEKGKAFDITPDNLHVKINDLAGIRLLHLHTLQAKDIHDHLHALLKGSGYKFKEGPVARTWDIEYEKMFKDMGFKIKQSETLYTSVHYVISDQIPGLTRTCEIQVRTLAEELWGEVDHRLNYPHKMESVACQQQIKALARCTSAASKLVDAIFATVADENSSKANAALAAANAKRRASKRNRPPRA